MMLGIIGTGAFGTALAIAASANCKQVFMWGKEEQIDVIQKARENTLFLPGIKLPDNIIFIKDFNNFMDKCNDLLLAVPSYAFREVVELLKPKLKNSSRIFWVTKGLDPKTGKFFSEIIQEILDDKYPYGVLSGPSFAVEIAQKLSTSVAVACSDLNFAEDISEYFIQSWFKVCIEDDLTGVQFGGVIKNIYAVATGIAEGLGFSANGKSALITFAMQEILELASAMKIKTKTVMGLSCFGDLILTCNDNKSRNRRFGINLAKGMSVEQAEQEVGTAEAKYNSQQINNLANKYSVHMPIATLVNDILQGNKKALEFTKDLS